MSDREINKLLKSLRQSVEHAQRVCLIAELEALGVKARTITLESGLAGYEIRHYRRIFNSCEPEVLALFAADKLSFSLTKVIASIPRKKQEKAARDAIAKKWSVHSLRAKLSENQNGRLNNDLDKLADQYSGVTGLDIRIKADKKDSSVGFWMIRYHDLEMFDTITEKLVGKISDDF